MNRGKILGLAAALMALGALIAFLNCADICPVLGRVCPLITWTPAGMTEWIRSLGPWGAAASVGMMVLHSFVPFPAELLTMANGAIYGEAAGIALTWVGAMLGALLSFGLTRLLGRPFVEKVFSPPQLCRLDEWTSRQGVATLLVSRLLPVISFNLINYAAGLTAISWWTFIWTTGVGIIPMTVLMVVMGSRLHLVPWWGWLLAVVIAVALGWIMWARRKNPAACEVR